MALAPKPVTLVPVDADDYTGFTPEPLAVIGGIAPLPDEVVSLTAVPATFADEAAVRTYLDTLVTQLKSSPHFN